MKKIIVLIFLFASVLGQSCKTNKEASNNGESDKKAAMNSSEPTVYPLILSFISIGAGTDYKAKDMLDTYLTEFNKGYQKNIAYESKSWGREGEVDLLFDLKDLNIEQKEKFITDIHNMFISNNLVKIKTDSASEH